MKRASLGPLARAVMLFIGLAAVAATTLLWQYLYGLQVPLVEALVAVTPTAVIGVVALTYAIRG